MKPACRTIGRERQCLEDIAPNNPISEECSARNRGLKSRASRFLETSSVEQVADACLDRVEMGIRIEGDRPTAEIDQFLRSEIDIEITRS